MCGRYVAYTDQDYTEMANIVSEIQQKLAGTETLKTGEIIPTDLAPVLVSREGIPMAEPMRWGFRRWDDGGVVINARAETAARKQMFRASLFTRRLVVPSTGFLEWRRTDGRRGKEKYWIRRPGENMLYMAGLYRYYDGPDGAPEPRFVILTTGANGELAGIHDRMPVILDANELKAWLDGNDIGSFLSRDGLELTLQRVS